MIPSGHVLLLALLQFTVGLMGLLLRRVGMVVVVSAVVMLNGVLLAFCATVSSNGTAPQAVGVVVLVLMVVIALTGASVLYAFHRFRKMVILDEHDRMKH